MKEPQYLRIRFARIETYEVDVVVATETNVEELTGTQLEEMLLTQFFRATGPAAVLNLIDKKPILEIHSIRPIGEGERVNFVGNWATSGHQVGVLETRGGPASPQAQENPSEWLREQPIREAAARRGMLPIRPTPPTLPTPPWEEDPLPQRDARATERYEWLRRWWRGTLLDEEGALPRATAAEWRATIAELARERGVDPDGVMAWSAAQMVANGMTIGE